MRKEAPLLEFKRKDRMISLEHCQEWNCVCYRNDASSNLRIRIFVGFLSRNDPSFIPRNWIFVENSWIRIKYGYHSVAFNLNWFREKYQCEIQNKCVAYTFDKSRMTCVLHASIDKGTTKKRRKQTGVKKADYTLSLPELNLCSNKNRQRRCKREPKCRHVNCIRNAEK